MPVSEYALKLSATELARYRMMAAKARAAEADVWEAAGIRAGATVADVGCGPGAITAAIAEVVGPTGEVWAVDRDAEALAAARAVGGTIICRVGDADATGLEPGHFDAVMLRHVLAHNGGKEQAIVEHLASLVRPGGCVYLTDIDFGGFRMWPAAPLLREVGERYERFHEARGNDLSVGLRLADLLRGAGLEVVEFRGRYDIVQTQPGQRPPAWAARAAMVDEGIVDQADLDRWEAAFAALDASPDPPTLFVPLFCAVGRRP
ncbi:MAG: methyltransferase domain-containing protein [Acidimicrobiales bacterium]